MQYVGQSVDGPYYPFWPFYGYTYLGPKSIPPLAPITGMTDRVTGAVWYLTFDPCNGCRLALVPYTSLNLTQLIVTRVFGPYDGPFINSNALRLGVSSGRLVVDHVQMDAGPGPWAFDLSGNKMLWMQLIGVARDNPNAFDHLAYDGVPWLFFGLTDKATGQVYYVGLDHETSRIALFSTLPAVIPNTVITRIHVYPANQGPGIGTSSLILGVRNGRLIASIGTKQFVLLTSNAFDSSGIVTQAAQFAGANVDGPFGIADQPPDHLAYSLVNPIINECPGGVLAEDEIFVLSNDDGSIILSSDDDSTLLEPA